MTVWPTYMYVYHAHVWCPQRPEDSIGSSGRRMLWASMWVLGTKPRSHARAMYALNYCAISSAPNFTFLSITIVISFHASANRSTFYSFLWRIISWRWQGFQCWIPNPTLPFFNGCLGYSVLLYLKENNCQCVKWSL